MLIAKITEALPVSTCRITKVISSVQNKGSKSTKRIISKTSSVMTWKPGDVEVKTDSFYDKARSSSFSF